MSERPVKLPIPLQGQVVTPTPSNRVYSCDDAGQVAFVQEHGGWRLPEWPGELPDSAVMLSEHITPEGFESRQHTRTFLGQLYRKRRWQWIPSCCFLAGSDSK